jgi:hypothetical protein
VQTTGYGGCASYAIKDIYYFKNKGLSSTAFRVASQLTGFYLIAKLLPGMTGKIGLGVS